LTFITITPKRVLQLLVAVSVFFMLMNVAPIAWHQWVSPTKFNRLWAHFDLNEEPAFPTWFSTMVLMSACACLSAITVEKRRLVDRFARQWGGLAVIFLLLSIDEVAGIHELLSLTVSHLLHFSHVVNFAWVIPAGLFVLLFFFAYLRFLIHLSPTFRRLFIVSGIIYVFGAAVMEVVGGWVDVKWGIHRVYILSVTVEEGCEMLGASLFVYSLLKYLQLMAPQVIIRLAGRRQHEETTPFNTSVTSQF
jgi:hypothetical protein